MTHHSIYAPIPSHIPRRRRRLFALLVAISVLLALLPTLALASTDTGHEQKPLDPAGDWARVQTAGTLVFGTAADYPPFGFYNSNQDLDGFDIALAKALGDELDLKVEFSDYAFNGLLNEVHLGHVDAAIAAISVTPGRQEVVDFTNLYYIGDSVALARATFTGTITSATDMARLKVGVQRGSTFQAWAQLNLVEKGVIDQTDLVIYSSAGSIIRDLRNGNIDVGVMGKLPARLASRSGELAMVGTGYAAQRFAIAVPRGSSLVEPLNEALLQLQSDGTFAKLATRYLRLAQWEIVSNMEAVLVANLPAPAPAPALTPLTPACFNSMVWVADLSLDDKAMKAPPVLLPGQDFTKSWRVRNSGTCTWPATYALTYARGNRIEASMGGRSIQMGSAIAPGAEIDITVALRAPETYGTYQGFWKMRDDLGRSFGEVVWVGVQVLNPNPPPAPTLLPLPTAAPAPLATPAPAPAPVNPNLRADSAFVAAGQCTTVRWDVDDINSAYFIDAGTEQGMGGHDARAVCPSVTTTYILRIVELDGVTRDSSITISVTSSPAYSINFWADSNAIDAGQCTRLRWDVRNVQAVFLNGEGVPGVSDREVCPGSTQSYTLTVTRNDGGQDARQVEVAVNAATAPVPAPFIERLSVSKNVAIVGECIGIEWSTGSANTVTLLRDWTVLQQNGPANGFVEDCTAPVGLHEYELVAYNEGGQSKQTVTVNIQEAGN